MISDVLVTRLVGSIFSPWRYRDVSCIDKQSRDLGHRPYSLRWTDYELRSTNKQRRIIVTELYRSKECVYFYFNYSNFYLKGIYFRRNVISKFRLMESDKALIKYYPTLLKRRYSFYKINGSQ